MAKYTAVVGDDFELKGHCLVAHPDGTVVTSSRSYRFTEPGKYTISYNAGGEDTVTVRAPKQDSPQGAGHTDE